ncbi:MAG TPA: hypothetical protein VHM27_09345 [Rhizomicrobium sp.]|nr:hypothetical protein [Rhizomicrobium sp.]
MAAKKKKAAKKASSKKAKKVKKAKKTARKAARKAAKKSKKKTVKAARKAAPQKATKKAAKKAAPKKAAKKPAKKKQIVGEGDYQASRAFLKDQAGFVKKNKDKIPDLGKEAEAALEGPQGDALREAEATAAARSRDLF